MKGVIARARRELS